MFYVENKWANSLSNFKWQGSMEGHSLTSVTNLSPTARWQSLSEKSCVTWETDCFLTRLFLGPSHKIGRRVKSHKTICHLRVRSFPTIVREFWSCVDSRPRKECLSWESFMGSKIYLKIYSNYIISCNWSFAHGRHTTSQMRPTQFISLS